jgi:hypothetical protein
MMMVSMDPTLRFPDGDTDSIQLFAETLKSNPPIDGVMRNHRQELESGPTVVP